MDRIYSACDPGRPGEDHTMRVTYCLTSDGKLLVLDVQEEAVRPATACRSSRQPR